MERPPNGRTRPGVRAARHAFHPRHASMPDTPDTPVPADPSGASSSDRPARPVTISPSGAASAASAEWWENFRALLNDQTSWPTQYLFKFIVPVAELATVDAVFPRVEKTHRASSKGSYASVSFTTEMGSAEEVESMYRRAAGIPGVVML